MLRQSSLVLMSGEAFHNALQEGTAGFGDFSLVVVDLREDYFVEDKHVYKEIMAFFHELKALSESWTSLPQVKLNAYSQLFCLDSVTTCLLLDRLSHVFSFQKN